MKNKDPPNLKNFSEISENSLTKSRISDIIILQENKPIKNYERGNNYGKHKGN